MCLDFNFAPTCAMQNVMIFEDVREFFRHPLTPYIGLTNVDKKLVAAVQSRPLSPLRAELAHRFRMCVLLIEVALTMSRYLT